VLIIKEDIMVTLEQTLKEYAGRRELTRSEKEMLKEEYIRCSKLEINNFKEDVIFQGLKDNGVEIPKELVAAYVYELDSNKIA